MEKVRGLFIIGFISWRACLQNLENRKGPFWKRVKRDGVSLINRLEGREFWAKRPVFFLPPRWETREGEEAGRRCRFRRPGARGGSGVRGKGEGRLAGSIPGRSSGGGGPGRPGHGGVR